VAAYRDAYANDRASTQVYAEFQSKYGVSLSTLPKIVGRDRKRNAAEYQALRKEARRKAKKPKVYRGAGGSSVWTVSGGLPGSGRRR